MDIYDEELLNFWRCLNTSNVKYIMVGGFATNLHGYSRFTADVDIWIKDTAENRKALRKGLELSENTSFEPVERMEFIPGWSSIYIASGIELDIMTKLKSFEQEKFDDCYKIASIADINGVKVPFLHLNQLIQEKRNVARPKDLEDAEALEKIRDITNNNK
jgi:predicted nucleotidyltransferase